MHVSTTRALKWTLAPQPLGVGESNFGHDLFGEKSN